MGFMKNEFHQYGSMEQWISSPDRSSGLFKRVGLPTKGRFDSYYFRTRRVLLGVSVGHYCIGYCNLYDGLMCNSAWRF